MNNTYSNLIVLTPMHSEHKIISKLTSDIMQELKNHGLHEEKTPNIHIIQTGMGAINMTCSLLAHLHLLNNDSYIILAGFAGSMDRSIKKGDHVRITSVSDWALLPNETFIADAGAATHGDIERIPTQIPELNLALLEKKDTPYYYNSEKKHFILETSSNSAEKTGGLVTFPCLLQGTETKEVYSNHGNSLVDMEAFALCSFLKMLGQEQIPQKLVIIKTVTDALDDAFKVEELGLYEELLAKNPILKESIKEYFFQNKA